jgi:hypothetical protein
MCNGGGRGGKCKPSVPKCISLTARKVGLLLLMRWPTGFCFILSFYFIFTFLKYVAHASGLSVPRSSYSSSSSEIFL